VSLLEAIAISGRSQGKVMALLDAGRGEVYAGKYEVNGSKALLDNEIILPRSELTQAAANSIIVTADHGLAEAARKAALTVEEIDVPRSDAIAHLGWQKILAGKTVSPAELDANYIRRSSEIFSKGSS
jgi:tRNA A37 threonylcarbamoyladenosine modification protein TsaB